MYTVFKFNNGELRSYVILGISIGLMIYILLFSKIFIKVNVTILTTLKNIISKIFKIVFYPINLICHVIRRVFFRPITFIFINIKNYINLSNIKIKRIVSDKKIKKNTR